jgi:TRAP-type C4-dicarboxylate transport system permease large subunit
MIFYREMSLRQFVTLLRETMHETAIILIIIAAAALYAWFLVFTQIPQELVGLVRT